jgi:hypothetical protein
MEWGQKGRRCPLAMLISAGVDTNIHLKNGNVLIGSRRRFSGPRAQVEGDPTSPSGTENTLEAPQQI